MATPPTGLMLCAHLQTALTEELVSCTEGNLNDRSKLSQLFRGVGFDVCDTLPSPLSVLSFREAHKSTSHLKVCDKLLHDSLPGDKPFNQDVGRT